MKYLSAEQKKIAKASKKEKPDIDTAEEIYEILNSIYEQRRVLYNDGVLTNNKKPEKAKCYTRLQINKPIEKKLIRLAGKYDESTIGNAFISYTDSVLTGGAQPENFMHYFLTYDHINESFAVFERYLNYFNLYYTQKNE